MDYLEARAEYKRTAARRARLKQADKEKAKRDERRAEVEAFRQSLVGLSRRESQNRMREFKAELRQRDKIERERSREAKDYWRQQRARQTLEARIKAETSRVDRIIWSGGVEGMSDAERLEWVEQCRQLNPIMYDILKQRGIA